MNSDSAVCFCFWLSVLDLIWSLFFFVMAILVMEQRLYKKTTEHIVFEIKPFDASLTISASKSVHLQCQEQQLCQLRGVCCCESCAAPPRPFCLFCIENNLQSRTFTMQWGSLLILCALKVEKKFSTNRWWVLQHYLQAHLSVCAALFIAFCLKEVPYFHAFNVSNASCT